MTETYRTQDNQTYLVAGRGALGLVGMLAAAPGCGLVLPPPPPEQPGVNAIVAVVEDAYDQLEQA